MIKEGLSTGKRSCSFLFFIVLFGINISCKSQDYNYSEVQKIEPTHYIKSEGIKEVLEIVKMNKKKFDTSSNTIVLYINKKEIKSEYRVRSTKTDFEMFKENKSEYYFSKIKGYLNWDGFIVLLYGDISNSLFEETGNKKISKLLKDIKKDEIPIIYEPTFLEFEIKDNILIKN